MKNAFLFIKKVCVFIVLAILHLFLSGNSKHREKVPQEVFEERRWTGTVTLDEKYTGITGMSERHVTVTFNNALPTLHRDVTGIDPNDPTAVDHFTDDKGTGSETYHGETIIGGKKVIEADCSGSGQAELHQVDINDEDYHIGVTGPLSTCTGFNLLDGTISSEPYTTGIDVSDRTGIRRDILSGTKTTTSDIGVGTVTRTITWHLVRSTNDIDDPCTACGSVIGIENQSLGQAIGLSGIPFTLHYRSDRQPGKNGALDIGAWTFNVHHTFLGQRLEFGDGQHRSFGNNADAIKAVVNEIAEIVPAGGYLIASRDGAELYAFDNIGRHLKTFDALTGALIYKFQYDASARLATIVDAFGQSTTIERTANGLPSAIIGPYGQRTEVVLDNTQHLQSVTAPAGDKTLLTYSVNRLLTKMIDSRGFIHTYQYDAAGRLVQDMDPAGGATNLARTSVNNGNSIAVTTALNRSSNYTVLDQTDGSQKRIVTLPDGTKNMLTISADGRRKVEFADGTTRTQREVADLPWSVRSPNTKHSTMKTPSGLLAQYSLKRDVTLDNPENPLSLSSQTDTWTVNGRVSTTRYLASQRTLVDKSPVGRTVTTTFNNAGQVSSTSITGLAPILFSYDTHGRLIALEHGTDTDKRRYEYTYNAAGNIASIVDPMMRSSTFEYDMADRVTRAALPGDRVISYEYDAAGNITAVVPPGQPKHTFEYNTINLVAKYNAPDVGTGLTVTNFRYDLDRQLSQITKPDGQTIKMTYDPSGCACGKLNQVIHTRGTYTYAYHPTTGRLGTITAPGGASLALAYDGALLTTESWTGPVTSSVKRSYNADFDIVSDQVSGSPPIDYKYDADGLLVQAGKLLLIRSQSNTLIAGTKLGALSETFTDNVFGELVKVTAAFNEIPLLEVQYTRDKLGRITSRTETIEGITSSYQHVYDFAGQLVTVIKNGSSNTEYKYDKNYNRVSFERPAITITGVYDNQDRLVQYGTTKFSYSAAGDLLTKTRDNAVTAYEYDVLGNLIRVALPNGSVIEYIVDGRNRRIGRKVNGILGKGYLYQDGLLINAELDGMGAVVCRFVYGSRPNVPDYMVKGGLTYRIIADNLGSPRLVVDTKTGKVLQRIDYDEFGNILNDTNPGFQPFGFAGGLYDPLTGLTRFGLRDYDAETGRWTTKDPLLFQGEETNSYSYVRSDPINSRDAFGLQMQWSSRGGSGSISNVGLSLTSPLVEGAFREMAFQAAMAGFTVTGKNEKSGHNVGSKHYRGNAIDVRCRDKSDKEVEDFLNFMRSQGYTVKDERVRPPGQKVWSGPHLHIEVQTPKPPTKPTPRPRPIQSGVCRPPL